jgi:hypothetical protein
VYPAIFVEESKLPFSRQDISKAVDDKVHITYSVTYTTVQCALMLYCAEFVNLDV